MKTKTLRAVGEREGSIIAYRVILMAMLKEIRAEYRQSVLPAYKLDRQYQADEVAWFAALRARAALAADAAIAKATRLLTAEPVNYSKRFRQVFKAATDVDIGGIAIDISHREARIMRTYTQANASLIKSLSDDAVKRVEQTIHRAKLANTSASDLSKIIQRDFGVMRNRANLIATDQLASLNSDLTAMHHKAVGVTEYIWETRRDDRVRQRHVNLHGNRYKHGKPTGAEDGLPPGRPIRCRCRARAVVPARRSVLLEVLAGVAAGLAVSELLAGEDEEQ